MAYAIYVDADLGGSDPSTIGDPAEATISNASGIVDSPGAYAVNVCRLDANLQITPVYILHMDEGEADGISCRESVTCIYMSSATPPVYSYGPEVRLQLTKPAAQRAVPYSRQGATYDYLFVYSLQELCDMINVAVAKSANMISELESASPSFSSDSDGRLAVRYDISPDADLWLTWGTPWRPGVSHAAVAYNQYLFAAMAGINSVAASATTLVAPPPGAFFVITPKLDPLLLLYCEGTVIAVPSAQTFNLSLGTKRLLVMSDLPIAPSPTSIKVGALTMLQDFVVASLPASAAGGQISFNEAGLGAARFVSLVVGSPTVVSITIKIYYEIADGRIFPLMKGGGVTSLKLQFAPRTML